MVEWMQWTHTMMTLSAVAVGSLLSAVWQGVVLAACVALCLRLIPGLTAAVRSLVWTAVLALVVMLHFSERVGEQAGALAAAVPVRPVHVDARWSLLVAAIWLVLSVGRGVQLIRSAWYLHGVARTAIPVAGFEELRSRSAGRRKAEICVSADVERPSVVGFWSSRILFPVGLMERLSGAEIEQIVVHEIEHLRRGDDWVNLLQKVSLVLFPLNPVLFWVERQLCMERELACDDGVLRATGARKAYALCLTNLAEHTMMRRGALLALGAWERQSELVRRVHRILRRPETTMGRRTAMTVTGTLVLAVAGGGMVLARSPEMVSFAPVATSRLLQAKPEQLQSKMVNADFSTKGGFVRDGAARMTLLKAEMPERTAAKDVGLMTKSRRAHSVRSEDPQMMTSDATTASSGATISGVTMQRAMLRRTGGAARRAVIGKDSWVVLTEWRAVVPAPEAAPVAIETIRRSYAAVPLGDGWLIFQL
jgi:beta-lactamase regulating signal transducer with metallopeptidase domain